ncbi:MAG: hypothetical protein LCH38_05310 [Proteobacteria bacterium]|nr:hypothetical protein [Pseudomonadota bacterium]
MSVSPAASKSLLLSNFAPASRLAPGQANAFAQNDMRKLLKAATAYTELFSREMDETWAAGKTGFDYDKSEAITKFAAKLGLSRAEAGYAIEEAIFLKGQGKSLDSIVSGGGTPVGSIATAPRVQNFGTVDEAKAFAQAAIKLLKVGIERFNKSVLDWSPQKAQEAREKTWQGIFDAFRRVNPEATEEEAIAFADKYLKGYLATEGHMDESVLRDAIERLQSGFVMSGPLYTENADGTLSLNRTEIRDRSGNLIFEIGADLGQNVDKAA